MGRCEECEDGSCALEEPIYSLKPEQKEEFRTFWSHLESAQDLLNEMVKQNIRYNGIKKIMRKRLELLVSIIKEEK